MKKNVCIDKAIYKEEKKKKVKKFILICMFLIRSAVKQGMCIMR